MGLERTARYIYLRFIRIRRDPQEIARGFAIGVFCGITPFFGFHILLALALALLLKGNKFMAILGTWIGNPLTFSFIAYLDYKAGLWILGGAQEADKTLSLNPSHILEAGWNILFPMTIGGFLIGGLAAVLAYFISNPMVRSIQQWNRKRT